MGDSSNAIINQGNISVANGGTLALISAKIVNDGNLIANEGNLLLGAGNSVTLDIGGAVKIQVGNNVLETLISNGGAIRADGGTVILTSQAAENLASSAINNTGLIEAQSLSTGKKGEVVLFAHDGDMNLGGIINAPGSFVETSGKAFNIKSGAVVNAEEWLIDPVNITIDNNFASAIVAALANGAVTITTDGACDGVSCAGSGSDGDITVDSQIQWNTAQKLTLSASRNILINSPIIVGDLSGELALHYGQGASAIGNNSDYSLNGSGEIRFSNGGKLTEKLGNNGAALTSHFISGAKVLPTFRVNNNDSSLQQDGVRGPFVWDIISSGNHMIVLQPNGFTDLASTSSQLGMSTSSVSYINGEFSNRTTNFSYMYQTLTLAAGETLTRAWNYTATDYAPFNDGSFLSFVNLTLPSDNTSKIYGLNEQVMILGATVSGTGNWSTKSYGSTGWQSVTLKAGQAGTYKLGYAVFNLDDTALSPYLFVSDKVGTTKLNNAPFDSIVVDPAGPLGSLGIVIDNSAPDPSPATSSPTLEQSPNQPKQSAIQVVQSTLNNQPSINNDKKQVLQPISFSNVTQGNVGGNNFGMAIGNLDVVNIKLGIDLGSGKNNKATDKSSAENVWAGIGETSSSPGLLNVFVANQGINSPSIESENE